MRELYSDRALFQVHIHKARKSRFERSEVVYHRSRARGEPLKHRHTVEEQRVFHAQHTGEIALIPVILPGGGADLLVRGANQLRSEPVVKPRDIAYLRLDPHRPARYIIIPVWVGRFALDFIVYGAPVFVGNVVFLQAEVLFIR
ncbi:hypothetical protein SDC9_167930 [bioreactor metagenome]|uniref:Uncharacterized protein n=1 Tax=bioreactor metagenome TaxID=1076179 RepID=A0A645G157_9ZZZZ